MTKEQILSNGPVIGREVKSKNATYLRIDTLVCNNISLVMRDQNDGDFFIVNAYEKVEADKKIDFFTRFGNPIEVSL